MDWQNRLLDELIYERVRLHVDIFDLVDFERELCSSIAAALRAGGTEPGQVDALARAYLQRAWGRVEQDWQRARDASPADCALCEPPFECPEPPEWPARHGPHRSAERQDRHE